MSQLHQGYLDIPELHQRLLIKECWPVSARPRKVSLHSTVYREKYMRLSVKPQTNTEISFTSLAQVDTKFMADRFMTRRSCVFPIQCSGIQYHKPVKSSP